MNFLMKIKYHSICQAETREVFCQVCQLKHVYTYVHVSEFLFLKKSLGRYTDFCTQEYLTLTYRFIGKSADVSG